MPPSPVDLAPPTDTIASGTSADTNAWYIHQSVRHAAELTAASRREGIAAAERDIDCIVAQLALTPRDRLLEIGCAWGRHSLVLHERGFRNLTSVDIAPAMLSIARERAAAAGAALDLRQCDFRALTAEAPFDAILSLYDRSCVGFPTEDEDRRSLALLHRMLRPGGQRFFGIGDWPIALPIARRDWREWAGTVELLETRNSAWPWRRARSSNCCAMPTSAASESG